LQSFTIIAAGAVNRVWIRGAGTSNWGGSTNWSPTGIPQPGDSVFITATDSFAKTVILDGLTFASNHNYQQVWIDESGAGNMLLYQVDLNLQAGSLNVSVSGPGSYNMDGGTGSFGSATLGVGGGSFNIGSSSTLTTGTFRQIGGNLTVNGAINCTTFIQTGGSLNLNGTYSGVNFTQSGGSIFTDNTITLTGTYTYNSGLFRPPTSGGGNGGVNCGTFIDNAGTFEGVVDTAHLIVNGSGTFVNGVTNRGALNVPASQTIWTNAYFDQIGSTVTQNGNVGGEIPGGSLNSDNVYITIGGGATWTQQAGQFTGRSLAVGAGNGGPGTYILNGNGTAHFSGIGVGAESDGTVLQSAGFAQANLVTLGGYAGGSRGISAGPGQRGVYNISGGSLLTQNMIIGPAESISGTLIQTGGLVRVTNQLITNPDNSSTAVINISGGTCVLDDDSSNNGSFTQTGGVVFVTRNLNGFGDVTVTGNGSFTVKRIRQDSLSLGGSGHMLIGGLSLSTIAFARTTSRVKTLNFEQTGNTIHGTLDLSIHRLVVDYDTASPAASIRQYIASAYAGGSWTGPGLTSSSAGADPQHRTALGYAESSSIFGPSGGTFVDLFVDNTAIMVKHTWYGDTDLDGDVDIADLGALAGHWQSPADWHGGDSDYNGFVDINDLGLLAGNWQAGVGNPLGPSLEQSLAAFGLPGASVPEPRALLSVAFAGITQRRVRHRRVR
jgi:hypothetical protein